MLICIRLAHTLQKIAAKGSEILPRALNKYPKTLWTILAVYRDVLLDYKNVKATQSFEFMAMGRWFYQVNHIFEGISSWYVRALQMRVCCFDWIEKWVITLHPIVLGHNQISYQFIQCSTDLFYFIYWKQLLVFISLIHKKITCTVWISSIWPGYIKHDFMSRLIFSCNALFCKMCYWLLSILINW